MTHPSEAASRRAAEEICAKCGHVEDDQGVLHSVACIDCLDTALARAVAEERRLHEAYPGGVGSAHAVCHECTAALRTAAPAKETT